MPITGSVIIRALGWLGSIMLSLCAAPQAYECYKQGHAKGLSKVFLGLWSLGEILTLIAVSHEAPKAYLICNYLSNIMFLSVIWYYLMHPKSILLKS